MEKLIVRTGIYFCSEKKGNVTKHIMEQVRQKALDLGAHRAEVVEVE